MSDDASSNRSFIERLKETIARHHSDEQFGVEMLAREMGVSKSQLQRKLHQLTNKSASQLIRETRLKKAKELLKEGKLTVSEVAYQVGFSSPTYFSTCFREFYGYTPVKAKFKEEERKLRKPFKGRKMAIIISAGVITICVILLFSVKFILVKPAEDDRSNSSGPDAIRLIVFPPENNTGIDTLDWFISELHRSMISNISKIGAIEVISPYTSRIYKNSEKTMKEIASELNVDYVVDFSISCLGDDICLPLGVYETVPHEKPIYFNEYSQPKQQILNLYNQITKSIAHEINIKVSPREARLLSESRTVNPDAYDAYFRSHQYWDDFSEEALNKALGYLNIAVEKDPEWAPLYVGLAKVWVGLLQFGYVSPEIAGQKIDECIYKAQELDPDLPDLHFVMHLDAVYDYRWEKAEKELLEGLAINPSDALTRIYYALLLMQLQRSDEALVQGQLAVDVDPLNPLILTLYGAVLNDAGDSQSAIAHFEKALSIDPDHYFASSNLETSYYLNGDYEKSIELLKYNYPFKEEDLSIIKKTYNEKGYPAAAEEIKRVWEEVMQKGGEISPFMMAEVCMRLKKHNEALEWIEKAYEMQHPMIIYIGTGNTYDSIRNNPRFIRILKEINLPLPIDH